MNIQSVQSLKLYYSKYFHVTLKITLTMCVCVRVCACVRVRASVRAQWSTINTLHYYFRVQEMPKRAEYCGEKQE